jgi:hypothetical protein
MSRKINTNKPICERINCNNPAAHEMKIFGIYFDICKSCRDILIHEKAVNKTSDHKYIDILN